jgi:hypothetical protein
MHTTGAVQKPGNTQFSTLDLSKPDGPVALMELLDASEVEGDEPGDKNSETLISLRFQISLGQIRSFRFLHQKPCLVALPTHWSIRRNERSLWNPNHKSRILTGNGRPVIHLLLVFRTI